MTFETQPLKVNRYPGIDALAAQWQPLAAASGSPFATWEWISTWWEHFGEQREQRIFVCEDSAGTPVAIVPLYLDKGLPVRILRFVGHAGADLLGPICAPEHRAEAMVAVRAELARGRDWDLFMAERLPAGLGASLEGSLFQQSELVPEMRLETDDWDKFLAGKSSNFRGQARSRERRLIRDHGLRFELTADPDCLDRDLETLFTLNRERWNAEGKPGAFDRPVVDAFHRQFARRALDSGMLRLWIAYMDDRPAAAWYGFRFGGTDWSYQSGRRPDLPASLSIGFVMIVRTLRDSIESGCTAYSLLTGGEEYKGRFSTDVPEVETFTVPRGTRGRVALRAREARRAAREAVAKR
jgi:CelD/BcsL family acetyltransferase involved in cellulose biosynthesis